MDRSHSMQFVPLQPQLCPWQSIDEDNFLQNLQKHDIHIKQKTKSNEINPHIQQFKQQRQQKFTKIIQQHRQRILKRKTTHHSTMSLQKPNKQPCIRPSVLQKIKHLQQQYEQKYSDNNRTCEFMYKRSNTLNKIQEQAIRIKQFNSKLSVSQDDERQIIKRFYRTRNLNKNADKYYGNLNKKIIEMKSQKSRSISSHQQIYPSKQIPIITSTHTKFYSQMSKPKNPVQSIVEIKLVNYRSSKSIQNLVKQIRQSKGKKSNMNKKQNHVLDKILVNR